MSEITAGPDILNVQKKKKRAKPSALKKRLHKHRRYQYKQQRKLFLQLNNIDKSDELYRHIVSIHNPSALSSMEPINFTTDVDPASPKMQQTPATITTEQNNKNIKKPATLTTPLVQGLRDKKLSRSQDPNNLIHLSKTKETPKDNVNITAPAPAPPVQIIQQQQQQQLNVFNVFNPNGLPSLKRRR